MLTTLVLLACIGAGTIGGVFFAFSTFVMKALAQLPASQGVGAMQRINVVVLNPLFLGVFVGTVALGAGCVIVSFLPWHSSRSLLLLAESLLTLFGSCWCTLGWTVPMINRLGRLDPAASESDT